jgi:hypothetical protein
MSIGSLLLYFFGVASFSLLSITLSAIEVVLLLYLAWWAWSKSWDEAKRLLLAGIWAGCLATFAYDIVRVPIVHAGVPVFKAISYFGTVLLGQDRPSALSELLGWSYHLSNGVSFALMYVAFAIRPGPITAVLWGLSLEGVMLVTPYAEVFGYQRDARFMAITIGSHAVYGLVLWLGLRNSGRGAARPNPRWVAAAVIAVPLALWAMAADFNGLYGRKIPQSPPPSMGPHLYTVWNVPEPDRIAVMWVTKRFVDREATFYFIEPFDKIKFGKPFDIPEASVRRSGTQSATQVVVTGLGLKDSKLDALAHMTSLTEITPWMLASDATAGQLAERLRKTSEAACGKSMTRACLPQLLLDLDDWYRAPIQ